MKWPWTKTKPEPKPAKVYPPGTKIIETPSFMGARLVAPYDELVESTAGLGVRRGDSYTVIPWAFLPFGWSTRVEAGIQQALQNQSQQSA